ncbi:hypothetical protein G5I_13268 [Acromyrmex echinatior]|uniref:Uncharacterized protein n=1 Tax=Acromyrmex echinatior TaxID=103372 RepID=F4X4K3_ACREC|nr:hypothetical protein G5I_13268 [Acromyrmex echinatior]
MKWRCIGSTSLGSHLRTGVEEESLRVKRDEEKRNAKHGERMNGQTRAEREEVEAKVIRHLAVSMRCCRRMRKYLAQSGHSFLERCLHFSVTLEYASYDFVVSTLPKLMR